MLHPCLAEKADTLMGQFGRGVLRGCPVGAARQLAEKADILFGTVGGVSIWMFDGEVTLCQEV
jgi:hypothetical protein